MKKRSKLSSISVLVSLASEACQIQSKLNYSIVINGKYSTTQMAQWAAVVVGAIASGWPTNEVTRSSVYTADNGSIMHAPEGDINYLL